jgi:hypothetical protein
MWPQNVLFVMQYGKLFLENCWSVKIHEILGSHISEYAAYSLMGGDAVRFDK